MPNASSKPVVQKLGLKPEHRAALLGLPKGLEKNFAGRKFEKALSAELDAIVAFFESLKELEAALPKMKKALKKSGMAWVCWRKGNVTDLERDGIHELSVAKGLDGVSSISIDDDWSALKLMYPKAERR